MYISYNAVSYTHLYCSCGHFTVPEILNLAISHLLLETSKMSNKKYDCVLYIVLEKIFCCFTEKGRLDIFFESCVVK